MNNYKHTWNKDLTFISLAKILYLSLCSKEHFWKRLNFIRHVLFWSQEKRINRQDFYQAYCWTNVKASVWDNVLIPSNFSPSYNYFILYKEYIKIWKRNKMYLILGGRGSQNSEIYRHTGSKNSLIKVSRAKVVFLKVMKFYWYGQHELISDKWKKPDTKEFI